ncbi:hypothetical protein [Dialister pneumosintes]|jgi:hypothetical protein|uniref:hypothetical protein n=1 Tax=Dialister pneumosintes TaxID=39950 RepID=UPI0015F7C359|nr:hypothetical protein [Dialister pneumosintes]
MLLKLDEIIIGILTKFNVTKKGTILMVHAEVFYVNLYFVANLKEKIRARL